MLEYDLLKSFSVYLGIFRASDNDGVQKIRKWQKKESIVDCQRNSETT